MHLHLYSHSLNPLDKFKYCTHGDHWFLNCPVRTVWDCNYTRLSLKTTRAKILDDKLKVWKCISNIYVWLKLFDTYLIQFYFLCDINKHAWFDIPLTNDIMDASIASVTGLIAILRTTWTGGSKSMVDQLTYTLLLASG